MRKNYFECNVNSLQKAILDLVDLSHSTVRNEANHREAFSDNLPRVKSPDRCRLEITCGRASAVNILDRSNVVPLVRKRAQKRFFEKAPCLLIGKQQLFDASSEIGSACARTIQKGAAVLRLLVQRGTEQLLDGLFLTGHDSYLGGKGMQ